MPYDYFWDVGSIFSRRVSKLNLPADLQLPKPTIARKTVPHRCLLPADAGMVHEDEDGEDVEK